MCIEMMLAQCFTGHLLNMQINTLGSVHLFYSIFFFWIKKFDTMCMIKDRK